MSTVTDPIPSDVAALSVLEGELGEALDESRTLIGRISELYCMLAEDPDPESPEERELRELITQRRALASRLGQAVLRLVARGATVAVHPDEAGSLIPTSKPTPTPSPAPDRATPVPPAERVGPRPAPREVADDEKPNTPIVPVAMPSTAELSHTTSPAVRTHIKPPKVPDSVPADPAALIALAQLGLTPQWSQRRTHTARRKSLDDLVQSIGKPSPLKTREDVAAAVQRLTGGIGRMDAWLDQSQEAQKALMGLISSLARQIQDESEFGLTFAEDEALRSAFSRMTAWSREHRPGFVPGLSRSNPPDHGSWHDDYHHWYQMLQPTASEGADAVTSAEGALGALHRALEQGVTNREDLVTLARQAIESGVSQSDPRLVSMLTPFQSSLQGARGLKTLKTALRDALNAEEQVVDQADRADPIPDGWPMLQLTEGKHAVILGGDPRPSAIERIHGAFRLRNLEWEESDVRRVRALAERIRRGSIDLVIVLRRFISHREHDLVRPACQEADVPICVVDTGYGVTQIRLAMERYWASRVES
ncbi:MAG: hypothetical protein AAGA48_10330 [Myxococcota bacterium]